MQQHYPEDSEEEVAIIVICHSNSLPSHQAQLSGSGSNDIKSKSI